MIYVIPQSQVARGQRHGRGNQGSWTSPCDYGGFRVLASRVAEIANPDQPGEWFTALGQDTFEYVDGTRHPAHDEATLRAIKEAAYDTLRMMFDSRGFEK
jgi:hypothetical protein